MSLDRPLPYVRGRTTRELVLLGSAIGLGAAECRSNLSLTPLPFAVLAVMLALRWFPARVVFLSMCVSAAALRVGYVLGPDETLRGSALPLAGIALLALLACGGDLVRRFDDQGRAAGPFANYWRTLAVGDRRRIAWMAHALSACGAALYYAHFKIASLPGAPAYLAIGAVACTVAGLLLVWGRAVAAPVTLAVGVYIACSIAPRLPAAMRALDGEWSEVLDASFSPGYLLVAFGCACAAVAIALPWSLRFVRSIR